jgi:hypothetical protein
MYPITMSFTVNNEQDLARLVAAAAPSTPATSNKQEAKKPDPKPVTPASQAEAAKSAPPADTPATPEPTAAASGDLDYEKDVKPAFLKLVQTKGRAAGRKIIDAFAPTKEKLSEAITTQEQFAQALKLIAKEMA